MPGSPLSLEERELISVALIEDRDIARAAICRQPGLERRHPTTIALEVMGNDGRRGHRPAIAQATADASLKRLRLLGWPSRDRYATRSLLSLRRAAPRIRCCGSR